MFGRREAAVPEQDALVGSLPAGPVAAHDLAELRVQPLGGQPARVDVRAQRPQRAGVGLAPVVDHDLLHRVGQVELDRADGSVGNDQRPRADPGRAQERLGGPQP